MGRMSKLLTTADAADAIGVHRRTLQRWWSDGRVSPTERTVGGHARWDLDELRRQVRALTPGQDQDEPDTGSPSGQ